MSTRKLYDIDGFYLGVITIPDAWDDYIRRYASYSYNVLDNPTFALTDRPYTQVEYKHAMIRVAASDGGVAIDGITIEEFEKTEGCSFSPSAAYVRRACEEGKY